ncbi:MAG TPA: hypothetical protein VJG32_10465 [Anaerolineae bacterium]|nr:hypothetical protein [Anaerolineae bacterium]
MQGGQQFKVDQPGLMKAGPVAVVVGAVAGLLWISIGLWSIASLLGYVVPIFAGVWYVMTARKAGAMPAQMDSLVNGAILGAVAALVYGIVALITSGIAVSSASLGLFAFSAFGVGSLITSVVIGAALGAGGAFGYSFLVNQGTIK